MRFGVQKSTNKIASRLLKTENQLGDMLFFTRCDSGRHDQIKLDGFLVPLREQVAELAYRIDRRIFCCLTDVPANPVGYKHLFIGVIPKLRIM